MSLNGLDSQKVANAYQSAIADATGWFLLHYKSRDELDVLRQGTGGYAELVAALTALEEQSPLYGLFLYRRRKVLLKYIPEDTSRLLQARVSVHYKAITAHFAHDAEFSSSSPKDITETALLSACSLHAEAPSSPSSPSLRRRNLSEITENSEPQSNNPEVSSILARLRADKKKSQEQAALIEPQENEAQPAAPSPGESHDFTAEFFASLDPTQAAYFISRDASRGPSPGETIPQAGSPIKTSYFANEKFSLPSTSPPPKSPEPDESEPRIRRPSPGPYKDIYDTNRFPQSPTYDPDERSFTAESKRSFAAWKPKIKLFPRPATSESMAKPKGDTSARQKLPSSIRIAFQRNNQADAKSTKSGKSGKLKKLKWTGGGSEEIAPPLPTQETVTPIENGSRAPPKTAPPIARPGPDPHKLRSGALPTPPAESPTSPVDLKPAFSRAISPGYEDKPPTTAGTLEAKPSYTPLTSANVGAERLRLLRALEQRNKHLEEGIVTTPTTPQDLRLDNNLADRRGSGSRSKVEPEKTVRTNSRLDMQAKPDGKAAIEVDKTVPTATKTAADSGVALEGTNGRAVLPKAVADPQEIKKAADIQANLNSARSPVPEPLSKTSPPRKTEEKTTPGKQPFVSVFSTQNVEAGDANPQESESTPHETVSKAGQTTRNVSTRDQRRSRDPNRKRKSHAQAGRRSMLGEDSDGFGSDDSLMEELQFATVEEAQQVSLPQQQSPVSPLEAETNHSRKPTVTTVRSVLVHSPVGQNRQDSNLSRDLHSPPLVGRPLDGSANPKRTNVSADISRRLHTLQEMSSRESKAQTNYVQTSMPRNTSTAKSQGGAPVRPATSGTPGMRSGRSSASGDRNTVLASGSEQYNSKPMSITARIVRPSTSDASESAPTRGVLSLDLQQSELTVLHEDEAGNRAISPSKMSFRRVDRPPSVTSRPESRGSMFSTRSKKSFDMNMGLTFWGSRGSNDATSQGRPEVAPSIKSLETVEEAGEERTRSKTSRLLRRMSGISSKGANGTPSTGTRRHSGSKQAALGGCIVGDLNVQFPDTLLWKRRWVEIDPSGFLILSGTTTQERNKGAPRRYHLTELKRPIIPSQDGQELPYSILFDLAAGGTLQLACEDPISQGQVLKRLSDSHTAWINNT